MPKHYRNIIGITSSDPYTARKAQKGVVSLHDISLDSANELVFSATGGTKVPSGTDTYHFFTSPDTFDITYDESGSKSIEILVIGGGAAGGSSPNNSGGGGGAGGFVEGPISIDQTSYVVTIGAGGAAGAMSGRPGADSYFGPPSPPAGITALGGGGGGGQGNTPIAEPGGSGGGGAFPGSSDNKGTGDQPGQSHGISGVSNFGNPGGRTFSPGAAQGGGGGGAGGAGVNSPPSSNGAGAGGAAKVALSGDSGIPSDYGTPGPSAGRWFAGGGGADGYTSHTSGGGGGAGDAGTGADADGFTGSGGAGNAPGGPAGGPGTGGTGGSGIVIIKYST
tara:strand:- start:47 stop:1051 length:1005 start_codon:yes stop_codon:yes gene_type:complete